MGKTGIEFHWPVYEFLGPGTKLKKRLARGDPRINRLDKIAKQHDIDYARPKNLQDKWKADTKMFSDVVNFARTTVNDQCINHITNTANHPTSTRNPTVSSHPVISAPDHSTPLRSRIRKTKTNRYWRRDNHNIQLDTNAVINLSSVALSQDENQLLARGLSFCPTPRNINWTEVRPDFYEFSRRMRLQEYFHDYPPKPILTHSAPKAIGPFPCTGTLHLTLFLMLSSMISLN